MIYKLYLLFFSPEHGIVYKYMKSLMIPGLISLGLVWFMVFNATFNNISVILWQSVLLVA